MAEPIGGPSEEGDVVVRGLTADASTPPDVEARIEDIEALLAAAEGGRVTITGYTDAAERAATGALISVRWLIDALRAALRREAALRKLVVRLGRYMDGCPMVTAADLDEGDELTRALMDFGVTPEQMRAEGAADRWTPIDTRALLAPGGPRSGGGEGATR